MGKSSELNRLATYFIRQEFPRYHVIPCALPRHIDSELALDEFLGTLLVELGPGYESMFASLSLEDRMLLVLGYIERTAAPLILLLDNAENLLEEGGVLATCWEQFLVKFLRYEHQASLVLATSEWHGWFTGEQLFVTQIMLPPLSPDDGVVLLQQLGLGLIPVEHLRAAVEAVGGVPQCLEWVASLVQEPMLTDEWDGVLDQREEEGAGELEQAEMLTHRLQRLLEDSSLFGGPIALKLKPLLKRVIEQRLSAEARAALCALAVAPLPLGKPALQVLCARPAPLKELRDSSLLVAYPHRVQLLPMVASTVLHQFSSGQVQTAEERLIRAYTHWLDEGSAMSEREKGMIFTELVCLLMSHHRLLAAAELVLYHGWLSFHAGQILRLARRVQQVVTERPWTSPETDIEAESGALLLHYYLAPYLGETIEAKKRADDYERMYGWVTTGQLKVEPLMEVHLIDHLMISRMNEDRYEEAQRLLEGCFSRLESWLSGDAELRATLLSKQASLYSEWSGYTESHGQVEEMKRMRSQTIEAYRESFALLQRAEEEGLRPLQQDTIKKKQASVLNNLAYHLNRAGRFAEALQSINHCIDLKKQGYADLDSLAASYGEKSQILAALGEFEEALWFDELAREEIGRSADAGDTRSQADRWIYQVNQGRLYLLIGRADEAERLLRETLPVKTQRRKIYKLLAEEALKEIENARAASPDARFQLDWRWVRRYRMLSAYDAYWWWASAGPFTDEEQRQWEKVFASGMNESVKDQLREILMQSRDRELSTARAEHREPRFSYPALDIAEVQQRIADFLQLDAEIVENEPNVVVRRLYHGAIEDEVCFLRLIEATHEGEGERFWELTQQLYPRPTGAEMQYALEQVRQVLLQGSKPPETEATSAIEQDRRDARQEACQKVIAVLRDQFHLSLDLSGNRTGTLAKCSLLPPIRR
jgi:tetratricopeptide (TPR) repeat protein